VRALNLPFVGNRRAMLGDGRSVVLDLYLATVMWNEEQREVLVLQAEGGPLIGMSLLYGYRVILHIMKCTRIGIASHTCRRLRRPLPSPERSRRVLHDNADRQLLEYAAR
jgi:hypothetical protein